MPEGAKKYTGKPATVRLAKVTYDNKRGTAHQRGYTGQWQRAAKAFLRDNPLCEECDRHGHTEAATCVDHIKPHRGNDDLFWDATNWQALCKRCHDSKTGKGQ